MTNHPAASFRSKRSRKWMHVRHHQQYFSQSRTGRSSGELLDTARGPLEFGHGLTVTSQLGNGSAKSKRQPPDVIANLMLLLIGLNPVAIGLDQSVKRHADFHGVPFP